MIPIDGLDGSVAAAMMVRHINDLIGLEGNEFLSVAFEAIVGRPVDPEGMRHYRSRLAIGRPKIEILADLRRSAEARRHGATIPGLRKLVKRYRLSRLPIVGGIVPRLPGQETANPVECQLRRLEFTMADRLSGGQGSANVSNRGSDVPAAPAHLSWRERKIHDQLVRRIFIAENAGV